MAAAFAPLLERVARDAAAWLLALVPLAVFLALARLVPDLANGGTVALSLDWVPAYDLHLSFFLDGLSLVFALAISGIGTLVVLYSGAYLAGHPHRGRFLGFIMAFMGAMLGLVLADATPLLFAFWELTTLTSFLLIGFDYRRQAARRAAIQAIIITSAGGLGLLVAAVVLRQFGASWDLSVLRAHGTLAGAPVYALVLVPILVAAFTKSAQVPFHFWLPNAMEAPTPVSAFLHSATMVQGGVYLLARMSPMLGGTAAWTTTLALFGGATLVWGAILALKQIDLKQMLAYTTVASLGLLVLLIGIGTEAALIAASVYFVAHALYKAGLFLAAGVIDHETGVRSITALSGLREKLAGTFIAAAMATISMVGLPPSLGYLAKEEMYAPLSAADPLALVLVVALVLANALVGTVGLAIAIKPFMGDPSPTPKQPHEGSVALVMGPLLLGAAGIAFGLLSARYGAMIIAPMAGAIAGGPVELHAAPWSFEPLSMALWLSLATWALAGLAYWRLAAIRANLRRADAAIGVSCDRAFDGVMFGLIRLASGVTHAWHHGRLELYVTVVFVMLAAAVLAPFIVAGTLPDLAPPTLGPSEWGIVALGAVGVFAVLLAPTRLFSILALGVQGLATALLFLLFGAPDLAFTQLMVEILTVVVLALVMGRLRLDIRDQRPRDDLVRDAVLSLLAGGGVTATLILVLNRPFDSRLADFFARESVTAAHGHNIVNVILVDFRGLDTLGEISVVMGAGIAILALLQRRNRNEPGPPPAGGRRGAKGDST